MPDTYTDQFFTLDPGNPPPNGTPLTVGVYEFVDVDEDGFISPGDTFNGMTITAVYVGDTIRVNMNGSNVWITGVTFYVDGGAEVFTPTDGTVLSDATFRRSTWVDTSTQIPVGSFGPPCFVAGTLIATPWGMIPIEHLRVGDQVLTRDNGVQDIVWTGHRLLVGQGEFAPVRFDPGAWGNARPLRVSPQHRMLVQGWRAQLLFGQDEVLVAARHLVDGLGVHLAPTGFVTYHHIMCDRHEIITAEGAPCETFHPGDYILMSDPQIRAELLAMFPAFDETRGGRIPATARPVVRGAEARALVCGQTGGLTGGLTAGAAARLMAIAA